MKVTLLASTRLDEGAHRLARQGGVHSADHLAEFAGRACYDSFSRPNPATAETSDYIANIIAQQHFSVLEHASATFYIENVSRSLTHELVRHRHLSFSQRSQRYVDESESDFVDPPQIEREKDTISEMDMEAIDRAISIVYDESHAAYEEIVGLLTRSGWSRKDARSAARSVLPNGTETAIVVTGNHRTWRELISKRSSAGADEEIRQLAKLLLVELKAIAPSTYQDMEV